VTLADQRRRVTGRTSLHAIAHAPLGVGIHRPREFYFYNTKAEVDRFVEVVKKSRNSSRSNSAVKEHKLRKESNGAKK